MAVDDFEQRHRSFHEREERERAERQRHDDELVQRARKETIDELLKEDEDAPPDKDKEDHEFVP